eukprot:TRINITY_DN91579_c0_g1_i1.p1 TRINITY_DN91579_c0_g1~~TRINITY_DN91579_c0_g1_i1.p1  ORF type:complete len:507 (+),score=74.54 TRINITY_DN91579_c0_g1_i1:67-1587(+)
MAGLDFACVLLVGGLLVDGSFVAEGQLVPGVEVATWLSDDPFSDEPFAGYCAHAPVQRRTLSSPLTAQEREQLAGAELVGLQVAVRHGARIMTKPSKVQSCFQVENYTMTFECGMHRIFAMKSKRLHRKLGMEVVFPRATGHCGTGRLQDEAAAQFEALAEAMRYLYDFESLGINASTTKFRADEAPRVIDSVYLLASFLFPEAERLKLHSNVQSQAAWGNKADCPEALSLYSKAKEEVDQPIHPGPHASPLASQWQEVAGTVFRPSSFKDCLTEAACMPQALPKGFTRTLFNWAINESMHAYRAKMSRESCDGMVAPAIFELQDMLREQTTHSKHPLVIYGTHDTALVCILVALGAWDGKWPTYAETVVVEAYSHQGASRAGQSRAFFRLLRRGQALRLPGCGGRTICEVDVFSKLGPQALRDTATWRKQCHGGTPTVNLEEKERVVSSSDKAIVLSSPKMLWALITAILCMLSSAMTLAISRSYLKPCRGVALLDHTAGTFTGE